MITPIKNKNNLSKMKKSDQNDQTELHEVCISLTT